jgi:hypothetical protein
MLSVMVQYQLLELSNAGNGIIFAGNDPVILFQGCLTCIFHGVHKGIRIIVSCPVMYSAMKDNHSGSDKIDHYTLIYEEFPGLPE